MYTIYSIEKDNQILYIGKTNNFKRRKYEHTYRKKLDKSYTFKILHSDLEKNEAKILEEYYIKKYNTFNNGFNETYGEGSKGVPNKPNDGRFQKGNQLHKLRPLKKVLHIDTGIIYDSAKECEKFTGFPHSRITRVCNGDISSYKKNKFKYI